MREPFHGKALPEGRAGEGWLQSSGVKELPRSSFSGYLEAFRCVSGLFPSHFSLRLSQSVRLCGSSGSGQTLRPSLLGVWVPTLLMGREFLHRNQFTSKPHYTPLPR